MNRVIYKYELDLQNPVIKMAEDCTILKIAKQKGTWCIWVMVNPHTIFSRTARFEVIATGQQFNGDIEREYIDTIFVDNIFVFHIFKLTNQVK